MAAVTVCPYKYKLMDFVSLYHVFVVRVCLLCDTMTDARRTVSGTVYIRVAKPKVFFQKSQLSKNTLFTSKSVTIAINIMLLYIIETQMWDLEKFQGECVAVNLTFIINICI